MEPFDGPVGLRAPVGQFRVVEFETFIDPKVVYVVGDYPSAEEAFDVLRGARHPRGRILYNDFGQDVAAYWPGVGTTKLAGRES